MTTCLVISDDVQFEGLHLPASRVSSIHALSKLYMTFTNEADESHSIANEFVFTRGSTCQANQSKTCFEASDRVMVAIVEGGRNYMIL
jgi:hypothetical protein